MITAPPPPQIRREGDWETRLLEQVRAGRPVTVVCHKDPLPRLARLARHVGNGSGNQPSERARLLLLITLRQARAEGHTWVSLGRILGYHGGDAAQMAYYYAGMRGSREYGNAKLYRQLHTAPRR